MERSKLVLQILVLGITLGILGDALLRAGPWALNLTLWTFAVVIGAGALACHHRVEWPKDTIWLALPVLVFALGAVWRDSGMVKALNVLAMIGGIAIWGLSLEGFRARGWGLSIRAWQHWPV
jgi:hypothetical protein